MGESSSQVAQSHEDSTHAPTVFLYLWDVMQDWLSGMGIDVAVVIGHSDIYIWGLLLESCMFVMLSVADCSHACTQSDQLE